MCARLVHLILCGAQDAEGLTSAGAMAVLRELGRLAGSPDSAPAVEQLAAALAHAREGASREQVLPLRALSRVVLKPSGLIAAEC